jgi:hypothetical protein
MLRNITFTADDYLIEQARAKAKKEHKALNEVFRQWIESYARPKNDAVEDCRALIRSIKKVRSGQKFTRDEMNER